MRRIRIKAHYRQIGTSNRAIDKTRRAKNVGWRVSKSGRRYFEARANRSDKNRKLRI